MHTARGSWMKLDEDALPLELTAVELVFLADSINNRDTVEGDEENPKSDRPIARHLLLKLASLYLQLVSPTGLSAEKATVYVTEHEAWLLRGKVNTASTGIDKSIIGPALLLKLYDLLLKFQEPAYEWIPTEEPDYAPARLRLEGVRYAYDYESNQGTDQGPDSCP